MKDVLPELTRWIRRGDRVALAEVVAARNGRAGGRLADARGRIHEVPA
jgi:hypothetical protein